MSGLTRTEIRAVRPLPLAIDDSSSSSASDSTLTQRMPSSTASASSAAVLPMPENMILSGAMPAERGGRVAIKWGRDRLREINEIDRLGVKDAVAIGEMVHGAGSVEQPIDERAAFGSLRCRDDFAVGPDRRLEVRSRRAGVGGRRSRRRVEAGFASASGKAERDDKRANSCDPGKAQAGRRTQFGPSSIGSTISDRTEEATAWRNNPLPRGNEELVSAPLPGP